MLFIVKSGKLNKVLASRAKALKQREASIQGLDSSDTLSLAASSFRKTVAEKDMVSGCVLAPYIIKAVKSLPHWC